MPCTTFTRLFRTTGRSILVLVFLAVALSSCRHGNITDNTYLSGIYDTNYKGSRIVLILKPNHQYTWTTYSYDKENVAYGQWSTPAKAMLQLTPYTTGEDSRFEIINGGESLVRSDGSDIDMVFSRVYVN